MTGDINIDVAKPRHPNTRQYNDLLKRLDLKNLITTYTHLNPVFLNSSIIDHLVTSDPDLYDVHGTCPVSSSDHFVIYGCRKKRKLKHPKRNIWARSRVKFNVEHFLADISMVQWTKVYECDDPNDACVKFKCLFTEVMDIHLPWKQMSFQTDSPPWITPEFVAAIKERNHATTYSHRVQTLESITHAHRLRNNVTALKRNLQRVYCQNAIDAAGTNTKKLWKVIKTVLKTNRKTNRINSINDKVTDNEISHELNSFFTGIGPNLTSKIPESLLEIDFDRVENVPDFELVGTDIHEVKKLLFQISDAKATGADGIPVKYLKIAYEYTVPVLTYIINLSLTKCIVPDEW